MSTPTLRSKSFPLISHRHGKACVRVMKVVRTGSFQEAYEYEVETTLYGRNGIYDKCYTAGDNSDLLATDTQKNTVYVVAKKTSSTTPEGFGIDLCRHFLSEYSSILLNVKAEVVSTKWSRVSVRGTPHDHAFEKHSPEKSAAVVSASLSAVTDSIKFNVVSKIQKMNILKTTQSGFVGFLRDQYTLLPECTERCVATELDCEWKYVTGCESDIDYAAVRDIVRSQLQLGIFGLEDGGIYSPSLQATVYDAACLILSNTPDALISVEISTPNLHYLPCKILDSLGGDDLSFQDDVFIPTSEPSGTICCKVGREEAIV